MGSCCDFMPLDQEVKDILKILEDKYEDLIKTFLIEEKETKDKQEKQLAERHKKLEEKKNKNEEITKEFIKGLNKKELEVEIDILSQQANKLHLIFEIGLDLTKPLRKYTLDKFMAKVKSAPAVALKKLNEQIEEIKNLPAVQFLKSNYGSVLMNAMAKKGLSDTVLQSFKKELFKLRGIRRKAEREEFKIIVNEFEDEDISQIKLDIFSLIVDEFKDSKLTFEQYIAKKVYESMKEDDNEEDKKKENKKEGTKKDNKKAKKK